jgi:hypothetical protein
MRFRSRHQGFDQVGEIAHATERAQHDQLGMPRRLVDPHVCRHRMLEARKIDKPPPRPAAIGKRRDAGDLGIGRRQEQDIARRLAEVKCLVAFGDRTFLGQEKMHIGCPEQRLADYATTSVETANGLNPAP